MAEQVAVEGNEEEKEVMEEKSRQLKRRYICLSLKGIYILTTRWAVT